MSSVSPEKILLLRTGNLAPKWSTGESTSHLGENKRFIPGDDAEAAQPNEGGDSAPRLTKGSGGDADVGQLKGLDGSSRLKGRGGGDAEVGQHKGLCGSS